MAITITGIFWTPHDPFKIDYSEVLVPPGLGGHLLGTDALGRDVLSRILYGARFTLLIGLTITSVSIVIGTIIGMTCGLLGGIYDLAVSRLLDVVLALPDILIALAIAAVLKPGLTSVLIAVSAVGWRDFARFARAETLKWKEYGFVEAARAYGTSFWRILFHHILRNLLPIILIYSSLYAPGAILTASALSFLGIGLQPPTPEWGVLISEGKLYLVFAWWVATFPGIVLMMLVLGLNFIGDAFRDTLDPRARRGI
ncbi:MAG: ABC transporter permease [Candidatus Hadarchaeum sp.]